MKALSITLVRFINSKTKRDKKSLSHIIRARYLAVSFPFNSLCLVHLTRPLTHAHVPFGNKGRSSLGVKLKFYYNSPLSLSSKKGFSSKSLSSSLMSFFVTEESLHRLIFALWRVYHSNNLRLSQSFFRLINLITERGFRLKEILPKQGTIKNIAPIRTFFNKYMHSIYKLLPLSHLTFNKNYFDSAKTGVGVKNEVLRLYERSTAHSFIESNNQLFFNSGEVIPILEQIYEGIEANYLFYNASSYQSIKTLYRLTNSLWKIYSGHNLELSRNFTSLINQVTMRNQTLRHFASSDNFRSTSSLKNLVFALKRAFFGSNLQLKNSLVSLFRDIFAASNTKESYHRQTNTFEKVSNNATLVLVYRHDSSVDAGLSFKDAERLGSLDKVTTQNELKLKNYIDKQLKEIKPVKGAELVDTERLIFTVLKRLREEENESWRFERLQRGLF